MIFGCSPLNLGKIPILRNLFFNQVAATTTKQPTNRSLGQACRVADGGSGKNNRCSGKGKGIHVGNQVFVTILKKQGSIVDI